MDVILSHLYHVYIAELKVMSLIISWSVSVSHVSVIVSKSISCLIIYCVMYSTFFRNDLAFHNAIASH